jgi:hypothetical protein
MPSPRSTVTTIPPKGWSTVARDAATGGYWTLDTNAKTVTPHRGAKSHGDASNMKLNQSLMAMAAIPAGNGYWLIQSDGGIFTYGAAHFYGSTGDVKTYGPIVDLSPSKNGYWTVDRGGNVYPFGDAQQYGGLNPAPGSTAPNVVAMVGIDGGYWLLTDTNGVRAFGAAAALGGGTRGGATPTDIEATSTGKGYWVLYTDGTVEPHGDAAALGNGPNDSVSLSTNPDGTGYWILDSTGGVTARGNTTA